VPDTCACICSGTLQMCHTCACTWQWRCTNVPHVSVYTAGVLSRRAPNVCLYMAVALYYGVALVSGINKIIGLFCKRVSFAKEPYKRDNILQKRPRILSILLTVATPYRATHVPVYAVALC